MKLVETTINNLKTGNIKYIESIKYFENSSLNNNAYNLEFYNDNERYNFILNGDSLLIIRINDSCLVHDFRNDTVIIFKVDDPKYSDIDLIVYAPIIHPELLLSLTSDTNVVFSASYSGGLIKFQYFQDTCDLCPILQYNITHEYVLDSATLVPLQFYFYDEAVGINDSSIKNQVIIQSLVEYKFNNYNSDILKMKFQDLMLTQKRLVHH